MIAVSQWIIAKELVLKWAKWSKNNRSWWSRKIVATMAMLSFSQKIIGIASLLKNEPSLWKLIIAEVYSPFIIGLSNFINQNFLVLKIHLSMKTSFDDNIFYFALLITSFLSCLVQYQRQHVFLIFFFQHICDKGPQGPYFLKSPEVIRIAPCGALRISRLL